MNKVYHTNLFDSPGYYYSNTLYHVFPKIKMYTSKFVSVCLLASLSPCPHLHFCELQTIRIQGRSQGAFPFPIFSICRKVNIYYEHNVSEEC